MAGMAALLAASAVLFVCDPSLVDTDKLADAISGDGDKNTTTEPTTPQMKTYVGYGIDVFNGPTFAEALKSPLFKDIVYQDTNSAGGNSYIDVTKVGSLETTAESSEDVRDVYTKLKVAVSVKGLSLVPFFSAGFKLQFGSEKTFKSESMFYNSISSTIDRKHTLKSAYQTNLKNLIDSATLAAINDVANTPELLFNTLGTHIIISNGTGGALNVSALYNSDEEISDMDLKAAIGARRFFIKGSAGGEYEEKLADVQRSTHISVHATGGNVGIFGALTLENVWDRVDQWTQSIPDNATLSIIYQTVPIWDLATDPARKTQIEDYFYEHANAINNELNSYFTKSAKPREPAIKNGGIYVIRNLVSQKAIDATATVTAQTESKCNYWTLCLLQNTTTTYTTTYPVLLKEKNGAVESAEAKLQQWVAVESWEYEGEGVFSFKNVGYNARSLHASNLSNDLTTEPTNRSSPSQLFRVEDNGDLTVYLRSNLNDSYKVSVTDTSQKDNSHLRLDTTSRNWTKWRIEKVGQVDPALLKQLASK